MTTSEKHKPVIGLLGAIGSGKSHVARAFAELGCAVIDADQLARQAMDDPDIVHQVVEWWGDGVLTPEKKIDRKAIAKIVFNNPDALQKLEAVVHPYVHQQRAELRWRYEQDPAVVAIVEDCPLLLETHLEGQCDVLVFVDASRQVRLARVARGRGWDEQELARRENQQLPLDIKRRRAHHVIKNEGESDVLSDARRVLSQILNHES